MRFGVIVLTQNKLLENFMPIPDFQSIMLPLMKILSDKKEHISKDVTNELANLFNLSDDEKNELSPSGKVRVFENRVAWAKAHLNMAGLLVSPRKGCTQITESGLSLLEKRPDKINFETLKQFDNGADIEIDDTIPTSTESLTFGSESYLQDLVLKQAKELFPGYNLVQKEYRIKKTRIDILLINELETKLLAIELKKGIADRNVYGQISHYLNLLKEQFPDKEIEGVIIAGEIDESLKVAARDNKSVKLKSCKIKSIDLVDQ
jgi:hypothetical protein